MTKDEKIFKSFKNRYSFIFNDSNIVKALANHFDKRGSFISFVIAFLQCKFSEKHVYEQIKINKDEWIELFLSLYTNQEIIELFKKIEINPIVPLEQTVSSFNCFDPFITSLFTLLKQHENNLNVSEDIIRQLLKSALGYLLYNSIDCKIAYEFKDILIDPEYDTKYQIILNNTKLFATAKRYIVDICQDKINDLIVLLLGSNKSFTN
ncbi:MAG: hypothetical protein ACOQNV_01855 [Mycoplasmoidaceae bacterium]